MLTAKNSHTFQVWHLTQNFQDPFIYQILRLHFTVPSQSMPKPLGPCQEGDGLLNFDEFSLLVSGLNADGAEGPAGARHGAPLVSELPRLIMAYHGSSWNSDVFFFAIQFAGYLIFRQVLHRDRSGGWSRKGWLMGFGVSLWDKTIRARKTKLELRHFDAFCMFEIYSGFTRSHQSGSIAALLPSSACVLGNCSMITGAKLVVPMDSQFLPFWSIEFAYTKYSHPWIDGKVNPYYSI